MDSALPGNESPQRSGPGDGRWSALPDFTIPGNPAAIREHGATTYARGQLFYDTGNALAAIDPEGWTGRAADHFRDAHDLEPERWRRAGDGFRTAGEALQAFAAAVGQAQGVAEWAESEYYRGNQVTLDAKVAYQADVARARSEVAAAASQGAPMTLTIQPFQDPGQPIRDHAIAELGAARAGLEAQARVCADEVRAGCADAPEKPNWLESGLRFVGGIFEGAGEAVWDLITLTPASPVNLIGDLHSVVTGDLTPEELATKYRLAAETARDIAQAAVEDPVGFGKALGKGLLDWDTWADDPARAIGHLLPDALISLLTGGSGGLASRGLNAGADGLDALGDLSRLHLDDLDELRRLDDLDELRHLDGPPARFFEYDLDVPRSIDDQLANPSYSPANRDIIDHDYDVLGGRETPERFTDEFLVRNPPGSRYPYDWIWPADDGKVAGSERILDPAEIPPLDRVGGPGGSYFSPDGTPMSERGLPPDRLNLDRTHWQIDAGHPDLASGEVRVETSEVAPAFGQPGGGTQIRFLDEDGHALSQADLAERGVLRPNAPETAHGEWPGPGLIDLLEAMPQPEDLEDDDRLERSPR